MNQQPQAKPEGIPEGLTAAAENQGNLDNDVAIIESGQQEMRFGTGKKLGKDGCGY